MKKICIVTSSRADYGILRPLILKICQEKYFKLKLVATGMHLCPEFGNTYLEIEKDGINIHRKINIQLSSDETSAMSKTMGLTLICFADYFAEHIPDLLILLGDRYEIAAVAAVAANQRIPIAHLHGGETTEGAIDEFYRHAITKMSALHFVSCEEYRKRIIQLGEQPDRVFNVGALGVENILKMSLITTEELSSKLDFELSPKKYCVVTFHPTTLDSTSTQQQLSELMDAMDAFSDMHFLITKANSDAEGRAINNLWEKYVAERRNCLLVSSLGVRQYLSALKNTAAVIGNSSSGILEAPALNVPTINIGDRQKGRLCADSIIHCAPFKSEIVKAIKKALSDNFIAICEATKNPYGDGNTSQKIIMILKESLESGLSVAKSFYDIGFEV